MDRAGGEARIEGQCHPRFAPLREAFERNFRDRGEVGAAVAVYWRGECVASLWGGAADAATGEAWGADTLACMMSVAKGVSSLCVHMLADRGLVDLDAPVARYWPEFAAAGKAEIPVKWVMCHLAGLPVLDGVPRGAIYDWEAMTQGLARQAPLFAPGATRCYHTATMGFILGEIVRRVTGMSLSRFIDAEIGARFGIDYHIGIADPASRRFARMIPSRGNVLNLAQAQSDSPIGKAWAQLPADEDFNSTRWRRAEIPSANGHGTAEAVAKLYGLLAMGGGDLIGRAALDRATAEQWDGVEYLTNMRFRMALGFFLNCPPSRPMGPSARTFGHSGAGGAQSFADPELGLGFCYAPNAMHGGLDIGPRATALIEAAFRAAA